MHSLLRRRLMLAGWAAILFLIAFGSFVPHAVSAQTALPLKSDRYIDDQSVINDDPCGPPCFARITPGKTTFTEALTLISGDKRFSNVQSQQNPSQAAWASASGEQCCQLAADSAGIVTSIVVRLAPKVTAQQLLDKHGPPAYTSVVDYSTSEVAIALIYPKIGLVAWISPGDASSTLKPENPLVVALYFAPDQFAQLTASTSLNAWDGFKAYNAYKAATPVTTPLPAPTIAPQPSLVPAAEDLKSPCFAMKAPDTTPIANAPKQFSAPEQVTDPTHSYCAFVTTEHGVIVIELFPQFAPKHVNSFAFLANKGFYDGITWHRVIPGFVAQTGDPTGTGAGGPGYTVPLEANPAVKYDRPGMLGMARTNDPDSAGSQFFITYAPLPNLDPAPGSPGYTIFGRVVRGLEVAQQIRPRDQGEPPGDLLISIRVVDATTQK